MIPVEKLQVVRHIVTHENCPDGIASAMILNHVLPAAKVTFLQYDTPAHIGLEPEEGMLFCDFSPHKNRVSEFKEAGTIVLDHHKSQEAVVATFGELGVFADEKADPGVCGAMLAFREVWGPIQLYQNKLPGGFWEHLWSGQVPVPMPWSILKELATLAGIRDTWQRKDPKWLVACEQAEALSFWPIEELLGLAPEQWAQKLALGPILYARRLTSAQKAIDHGYKFQMAKGRRIIAFDGLRQSSDAAEILGDSADFVVGLGMIVEENEPYIIYSTRSHSGFDCAAFAMAHGGGGHTAAAGCKLPLTGNLQPFALLQQLLAVYESVEQPWIELVKEKKAAQKKDPELKVNYVAEYKNLL